MKSKALWLKEYKQVQGLIWAIFIALFFALPLQVMQQLSDIENYVNANQGLTYGVHLDGRLNVFLPMLFIALGCLQIGAERSNNQDNFTLSLPYSRPTIYLTKWGLGAMTLTLSLAVNFALSHLMIQGSSIKSQIVVYPDPWPFAMHLVLSALALYTLALFLGTLAGGPAFQAAFSLIFSVFPMGLMVLVGQLLSVHGRAFNRSMMGLEQPFGIIMNWSGDLSLLTRFLPFSGWGEMLKPLWRLSAINLAFVAVFLAWGAFLYARNRPEYNGRLLVFPSMQAFFITGITVCFAMLGGLIGTVNDPANLVSYYIGSIIAGLPAYLVTMRLVCHGANKAG